MKVKVLKDQITLAKKKTDQLIQAIPLDQWNTTPSVIESNLNWQVGHIILANYLQGVASITGPNSSVRERINVKDYIQFYGPKSEPSAFLDKKPSAEELIEVYELMMSIVFEVLEELNESVLMEVTEVPNPAVDTKYEALAWMAQHQSWHNGQIAMLKRVLKP